MGTEFGLRAGAKPGENGGPGAQATLPTRDELVHVRFGRHVQRIKELGVQMAREFDGLAEVRRDLRDMGVEVTIDLPEHVLTALSVHESTKERERASERR